MATLADVQGAVGGLETAAQTAIAKIDALKAGGVSPTDLDAVVTRINTVANNLTQASQ